MCGIAGILRIHTSTPVDAEALARMTGALVDRGPDDEGLFVSPTGDCGLGARRLSIIDLAGGDQPLNNAHLPSPRAGKPCLLGGAKRRYLQL